MSGEKTEQPTAKKLRDARQKGQVAKSQEVPAAAVVLIMACYFLARGEAIMAVIRQTAEIVFSAAHLPFEEALPQAVSAVGVCFLTIIAPLTVLVIVVSFLSNLAQVGVLFSAEAAIPKLENISPKKWFKKTFSKNNIFDLLKNVVKVVVLAFVVNKVLSKHWRELYLIPQTDADALSVVLGSALRDLTLYSAAAFAGLAAVDFVYQRFKFTKDNMMTKDEVKREYKEMEGDPLIKGKRKQLHQEMANQRATSSVKKAKVLVTNPTHYAVALDYEEGRTPLPIILAKGEGELAKRMIAEARREGVPILQEPGLARDLFEQGEEFSYIPKNLIAPVASVLRWLQSLEGQTSSF
ncbi:MAG: type III secretion system export apparatus subunit SctU [Deltaproteobacteria bacterium]|jgi:type III secretion protein U|nr:type III secretion system export apparatus subunit SctU [Deltaproteobacteria bacterium]